MPLSISGPGIITTTKWGVDHGDCDRDIPGVVRATVIRDHYLHKPWPGRLGQKKSSKGERPETERERNLLHIIIVRGCTQNADE